MSDLQSALMQYAIESGEISDPAEIVGAEEITVVTDETKSELEEAIEEMAEEVEKIADNADAAEKLVDATESLEARVLHLRGLREAGVDISGTAMDQFFKGVVDSMEARKIPAVLYADLVGVGAGASFESAENADKPANDKAEEAAEKGEGVLKRFWNMIKAAVTGVINAIKNFITGMGKSGPAVVQAGERLKKAGGEAKGEAKGKLSGKGYAALVVGSDVDANKALELISAAYTSTIKPGYAAVTGAIALAAQTLGTGKPNSGVIQNAMKNAAGKMPKEFNLELPGGYKAEFVHGKGTGLTTIFDRSSFKIVRDKEVKGPEEVAPLSPAEIGRLGDELVKLGGEMKDAVEASKAAVARAEDTLKKAEGFVNAAAKEDAEGQAAAKDLLKAAKGCVSTARIFVPNYMKFAGGVAKTAYKFGMASAAQYKGGEAKKDDGEKPAEKKEGENAE